MNRLGLSVVLLILLLARTGLLRAEELVADDWRSHVPGQWLVAVECSDLDRLEERLPKLLQPWGRRTPPIRAALANLLPDVEIGSQAWAVVLVAGTDGDPAPIIFAPATDFDALCDSLTADRAEDLAIASLAGFDIALKDCGDWVRFSLLDDRFEAAAQPVPVARHDGDLSVSVSPRGFRKAADFLNAKRRGQIAAGQGRLAPLRAPRSVEEFLDRLALYGPLAEAFAGTGKSVEVCFDFDDAAEAMELTLTAPIRASPRATANSRTIAPSSRSIARATLLAPLPEMLLDLAIAWIRCHPEEVEASGYPDHQWQAYASAQRSLLSGIASAEYEIAVPAEDQPVLANQIAQFTWDESAVPFPTALKQSNAAWNRLLKATDARSPTRAETKPLEETAGWAVSVDLFENAGLEYTPELETLFDRFYGHGGKMVTRFDSLDDNRWQMLMHRSFGQQAAEAPPAQPPATTLLLGEAHLHRLIAWQQQIEATDKQQVLGRKVRPPMAATPPALLSISGGETLEATATLPLATYTAAAAYWLSEKEAVESVD